MYKDKSTEELQALLITLDDEITSLEEDIEDLKCDEYCVKLELQRRGEDFQ